MICHAVLPRALTMFLNQKTLDCALVGVGKSALTYLGYIVMVDVGNAPAWVAGAAVIPAVFLVGQVALVWRKVIEV